MCRIDVPRLKKKGVWRIKTEHVMTGLETFLENLIIVFQNRGKQENLIINSEINKKKVLSDFSK